jgi:hypothetical protein
MARLLIDVKEKTRETVDKMIEEKSKKLKRKLSIKEFVLMAIGITDA